MSPSLLRRANSNDARETRATIPPASITPDCASVIAPATQIVSKNRRIDPVHHSPIGFVSQNPTAPPPEPTPARNKKPKITESIPSFLPNWLRFAESAAPAPLPPNKTPKITQSIPSFTPQLASSENNMACQPSETRQMSTNSELIGVHRRSRRLPPQFSFPGVTAPRQSRLSFRRIQPLPARTPLPPETKTRKSPNRSRPSLPIGFFRK